DSEEVHAQEYHTARIALENARTRSQQAHESLAAFIQRRAQETADSLQNAMALAATVNSPAKEAAPLKQAPNPTWNDLSLKLREISARRNILATRLTSEHPEMRQLDMQIAQLQAQL